MIDAHVTPVSVRAPGVAALVEALTAELATSGYTDDQTFGYSLEQLERSGVHLVGARNGADLVGIAGLEHQAARSEAELPCGTPGTAGAGELKRFYVRPEHRGAGVADALLEALVAHAREHGLRRLRLETGDRQHAAIGFYRRHGFSEVPRFGPYVDSATSYCMERELS